MVFGGGGKNGGEGVGVGGMVLVKKYGVEVYLLKVKGRVCEEWVRKMEGVKERGFGK